MNKLDEADVRIAVRALLGDPDALPGAWTTAGVDWRVVSDVTDALVRVQGRAWTRGRDAAWSMVVKTARPDAHDPVDPSWEREWRAYTSGLLRPTAHVRPARLLHVTRPSADRVLLWLEDVPDPTPEVWPPSRHVLTARHLGEWGAARRLRGEAPAWSWRVWMDGLCAPPGEDDVSRADCVWRAPLVREVLGNEARALLNAVAGAGERWERRLRALPPTLVHLDPVRSNVRAVSDRETVLLDWQALGVGPPGADPAMATVLNVCRFHADPDGAGDLARESVEAYLAGIAETGVPLDGDDVRFAFAALTALRTAVILRAVLGRLSASEPDLRLWSTWGEKRDWSGEEALRRWGPGMVTLLRLGVEGAS
ncbi:hypothetical protein [Deinococcus pimensis]|uniref:hypothetical protein n=1 Tax=Deinococcus pimensis TaxID=309888 RepID=UPI000480D156|nr:hypothetical protein [Deinococcus pimensis]